MYTSNIDSLKVYISVSHETHTQLKILQLLGPGYRTCINPWNLLTSCKENMCKNNIITILSVSNISPLNLHHRISNMQRKLSLIACALQKHPVFLALVQYTDKRTRDIKTGRSHRPDSPTIVDKSPWDALSVFFN